MKCHVCNEQVNDNADFCTKCGADLRDQKSSGAVSAVAEDKSGNLKLILLIAGGVIAAVIVAVLLFKGISSIGNTNADVLGSQLVMAMEVDDKDDVEGFILDGNKVIDLPNDVNYAYLIGPNMVMTYSSISEFDDSYQRICDLTLYNLSGKELCADEDVVISYATRDIPEVQWYTKKDDEEYTICNIVGGENSEVSDDIEDLFSFAGTDDKNRVYYLVYEEDEIILYQIEDGEEDDIYSYDNDDGYIYLFQSAGRAFMFEVEYGADSDTLYILNDDNVDELTDDFVDFVTFKNDRVLVTNADDELVVVDLDGDSEEIDDYDGYLGFYGDYFYYSNGDDLMAVDINAKLKDIDAETIVKNAFDAESSVRTMNFLSNRVYIADGDEIEVTNIKTGKSKTVETEEDVSCIFDQDFYAEEGCLFIDEDDELYFYDGKKVILIEDRAKDVDDAQIAFDGTKIIWVDDEDLMMCDINGKNAEEVESDVYSILVAWDGTVYVETYDDEILVLSKNGKTEEILSDAELYEIYYKE